MQRFLFSILVCLLMGAAPVWTAENNVSKPPVELSPEDRKVVAAMEILQLMDLTKEMEMLKDMNTLIEDDQNESQSN